MAKEPKNLDGRQPVLVRLVYAVLDRLFTRVAS